MSSEIGDTELKSELESFGATVGKINEKNRAILIKKLNHFRARVALNEKKKTSEKKRTTRRSTPNKSIYKTNESEEELLYPGGRSLRSRQIDSDLNDSATSYRGNKSTSKFSFDNSLLNYKHKGATSRNSSRLLTDYSDNENDFVDMQSIGINTSFPSPNDSILSDYSSPKIFSHSTPIFSKPQKIFDHQINRIESIPSQKSFSFSKLVFRGILVLFFAIIITYFYKSGTPSFPALDMPASSNEMCIKLPENKKECLQKVEYRALKDLVTHIAYKTGEAICNGKKVDARVVMDSKATPDGWVSTTQAILYLRDYYSDVGKTSKHEVDVTKLFGVIMQRADWNITVACASQAGVCKANDVVRLISTRPALKLSCRIKRAVDKLVFRTLVLVSGVVGLVWLVLGVRWYRAKKQLENKQVASMVKQIVELLKQHLEHNPEKDYIAACDVRDSIIQPHERKQKKRIWNRAVREIRINEAQVQQDVVHINGEETTVWKWIKPLNGLGERKRTLNMKEDMSNVISSAHLKILNILPANHKGDVPTEVRDAILDKCGQYHGILHMGCDPSFEEGTVYIKCVSEAAATQNFKALHAWTYHDLPVSVRQVSGVVYNMMFEESADAMVPLKSTAQRRRSYERSKQCFI